VGADLADAATQTRHILEIIRGSLEKAGARLEDVVRTRMYLTNADDWEAVGKAHGEFFGTIRPAATMVVVAKLLDPTWRVEIEADAVVHSAPHE
jgi:enamine deaminase RidA (YjgF/YER057c/UK114 family)